MTDSLLLLLGGNANNAALNGVDTTNANNASTNRNRNIGTHLSFTTLFVVVLL